MRSVGSIPPLLALQTAQQPLFKLENEILASRRGLQTSLMGLTMTPFQVFP